MRSQIVSVVAGLLGAAHAAPAAYGPAVKELYQFPNTTFIENIAVRPKGHLMLNTFDQARMYTFNPYVENPKPYVAAEVPGVDQLTGIVEIAPDVYIVSGGNGGDNYNFVNGTALIAKIDYTGCDGDAPAVTTVAHIPSAEILNGMIGLPKKPHVILSIDSLSGRLFRVNTFTGSVDVAWRDDKLGPGPNPTVVPLGANGLYIYNGYLYFTNSAQQFYARVEIDHNGDKVGDIEEVYHMPANATNAFDDFDVTHDGVSYIGSQRDSLVKITPDGELTTLIGPDSDIKLYSPTSVALSKDEKMAFVVTGGTGEEGGQVVAVQL